MRIQSHFTKIDCIKNLIFLYEKDLDFILLSMLLSFKKLYICINYEKLLHFSLVNIYILNNKFICLL